MANEQKVPDGFVLKEGTTTADGVTYPVEYLQAENLEAILAYYEEAGEDAADVILGIWNSANKQGATQSPKTPLRKVLDEASGEGHDVSDYDHAMEVPEVAEAMAEAQNSTRTHIIGAPRGATSGPTKKSQHDFGEAVTTAMREKGGPLTQKELDELAQEMGIS